MCGIGGCSAGVRAATGLSREVTEAQMTAQGSAGISEVYAEEGEQWLRVSPGHAVSEHWLQERAPDLYAQWWPAPDAGLRDQLARQIEHRLEELEPTAGSWRQAAARSHELAEPTVVAEQVARYENAAERLGAIALNDPAPAATHLAHQAEGDQLHDQAATPAGDAPDLLNGVWTLPTSGRPSVHRSRVRVDH